MNLKDELDKLAKVILAKAGHSDTSLTDAVDAFKATTAYYAIDLKRKGREPAEDEDENSFAGFQERLAQVEEQGNGRAEVGSHRGRRTPS
jgi:hypothetical protein